MCRDYVGVQCFALRKYYHSNGDYKFSTAQDKCAYDLRSMLLKWDSIELYEDAKYIIGNFE